jgi:hypothetical protein
MMIQRARSPRKCRNRHDDQKCRARPATPPSPACFSMMTCLGSGSIAKAPDRRAKVIQGMRWTLRMGLTLRDLRYRAGYPARAGGPWLCRTLVRSGFQAVVVPSGFRTKVQPHRWMTIKWWYEHSRTQSLRLVWPPLALCLTW